MGWNFKIGYLGGIRNECHKQVFIFDSHGGIHVLAAATTPGMAQAQVGTGDAANKYLSMQVIYPANI